MSFQSPHDRLMAQVRLRGGRHPAAAVALLCAVGWIVMQTAWILDHFALMDYLGWFNLLEGLVYAWFRGIALCIGLLLLVEWLFAASP